MLEAYSGLIDIFVKNYDRDARCALCTNVRLLNKITSTSQTASSLSERISNTLFLCNKYFD